MLKKDGEEMYCADYIQTPYGPPDMYSISANRQNKRTYKTMNLLYDSIFWTAIKVTVRDGT